MKRARTWTAAALVPLAAGAFLALGGNHPREARAEVPSDPPTFSDPTEFDNEYFPFVEGASRVFKGTSGGVKEKDVDDFLGDTRKFHWGGGTVTCRVLRETNYEDGELVEVTWNYFAQADDGSVYYFGEVVNDYEDGEVVGHGGSWLVGGPSGGDPEETFSVDDPALFMPADPEVGDQWMPEDVPDGPQELDEVVREDVTVKVPAGDFQDCIAVLETQVVSGETETKWYAPGIGVCKGKAAGGSFKLVETDLEPLGD